MLEFNQCFRGRLADRESELPLPRKKLVNKFCHDNSSQRHDYESFYCVVIEAKLQKESRCGLSCHISFWIDTAIPEFFGNLFPTLTLYCLLEESPDAFRM